MAWILQLETSSKNCSVALSHQGKTEFLLEEAHEQYSHGQDLHPLIQKLMDQAPIELKNLAAIAVGKGPGSYTGLRIGVSAAKGLAYALDLPLIGINSLELMVHGVERSQEAYYIPLVDARRMEVYTSVFDQNLNELRPTQALILEEENAFLDLNSDLPHYFFGDGTAKAKPLFTQENFYFLEAPAFPSAAHMSSLAFEAHQKKAWESVAYFEPFYLKEFMITPSKKKTF